MFDLTLNSVVTTLREVMDSAYKKKMVPGLSRLFGVTTESGTYRLYVSRSSANASTDRVLVQVKQSLDAPAGEATVNFDRYLNIEFTFNTDDNGAYAGLADTFAGLAAAMSDTATPHAIEISGLLAGNMPT